MKINLFFHILLLSAYLKETIPGSKLSRNID
jgi:hypothetical protein